MKLHRIIPVLAAATLGSLAHPAPAGAASCGTENLVAGKKPHESKDLKGDPMLITNGALGAEGTVWDAPVGVTFETPAGSVTYDLGEAREVAAIVLQADANDTYKILGSTDGASYKPLVEVANVVDRGHGLRTRAVEIPPATIRYLRVGEANGDGFYSIAELAAYCKKPTPFPPAMRVVEAPPAQAGDAAPAPAPKDGGGSILLLAAAALGIAWLAYRTINRSGGGPTTPSAPVGEAGGASGDAGASGGEGGAGPSDPAGPTDPPKSPS